MDNYLRDCSDNKGLPLAVSYPSGEAHEWWTVHQNSEDGQTVDTWIDFKNALITIFEVLHKGKKQKTI